MTVRSCKQGSALALRIALVVIGLALVALWAAFPQTVGEADWWNDDNLKTESFVAGDVLTQPMPMDAAFNQLSLRVEAVRETKEMSLGVKLLSGGQVVAEEEFPLRKVRAKGKLVLDFDAQPAGEYVLEITALGAGSTKLGAGESVPMQLNGQDQAVGCALRVNRVVTRYNQAILFTAVLLALLALTPWGRKEADCHA